MKYKGLQQEIREFVYAKFGGKCAYCGDKLTMKTLHVDHVRPRHLGGTDKITNLYPACQSCNIRKQTLSIEEFREELEAQPFRLRRDRGSFRLAERYGLIVATGTPVKFFFEGWQGEQACSPPE